jgi:hypothetical protein
VGGCDQDVGRVALIADWGRDSLNSQGGGAQDDDRENFAGPICLVRPLEWELGLFPKRLSYHQTARREK